MSFIKAYGIANRLISRINLAYEYESFSQPEKEILLPESDSVILRKFAQENMKSTFHQQLYETSLGYVGRTAKSTKLLLNCCC